MSNTIILIIVLVVILAIIAGVYNSLVALRNQVQNSRAQIDVQLKRRHDLIPNLLEAVKGYMAHEANTLENIVKLRQQAINVTGSDAKVVAEVENQLSSALKSLFALSENYPDLKASQNFSQFQEELASTENKISFARQFYNDSVLNYNNKIQMFPSNIIAGIFNFTQTSFFEASDDEKENPQVKF